MPPSACVALLDTRVSSSNQKGDLARAVALLELPAAPYAVSVGLGDEQQSSAKKYETLPLNHRKRLDFMLACTRVTDGFLRALDRTSAGHHLTDPHTVQASRQGERWTPCVD